MIKKRLMSFSEALQQLLKTNPGTQVSVVMKKLGPEIHL